MSSLWMTICTPKFTYLQICLNNSNKYTIYQCWVYIKWTTSVLRLDDLAIYILSLQRLCQINRTHVSVSSLQIHNLKFPMYQKQNSQAQFCHILFCACCKWLKEISSSYLSLSLKVKKGSVAEEMVHLKSISLASTGPTFNQSPC